MGFFEGGKGITLHWNMEDYKKIMSVHTYMARF